ncbi:sorting nexin-17-like [Salvelinus sp. IW2-2015]|uniref:sorting nexin-17-like n=1 Tax=Salvelinus sp. IW2-2015 TaxID=2691554 RepID=UPI000CEB3536|nr:sorting nexin-17-like [Salvelinus alpinus]
MLGTSEMFNSFLRKAQQETQQIPTEEVPLEIYLSNGQKVEVNILTSDQTEDVLEAVASQLDLPDELVGYFSLFLVREGVEGGLTCKRSTLTPPLTIQRTAIGMRYSGI